MSRVCQTEPVRPTLLLKFAEASDGFLSWRWSSDLDRVEAAHIGADVLAAVQAALGRALPNPIESESTADALRRALTTGALAAPDTTEVICRELGNVLIPQPLQEELRTAHPRPWIRIQSSPAVAQVPWELVAHQWGDVITMPPATSRHRRPSRSGENVVAVIDPRIPGQTATSSLGSVLGRPATDAPLAQLLSYGDRLRPTVDSYVDLARRRDLDRAWLQSACADAGRLLFVGHTSNATGRGVPGENSAIHLCDVDGSGAHEPLTAGDLLTGHGWQIPPRVALIGCESGGDARDHDHLGLTMACVALGAELVTATRWVLPTDQALVEAFGSVNGSPLQELVLAVDAAHAAPDPIAALAQWRSERWATWRASGRPEDHPLLWAALTTSALTPMDR